MKKNVVFWVGVKNETYSEKYGGWEWLDISRKTWEYWCKKNDVIFFPFEKPIENDLKQFRINWQKALFVFDELDQQKIEYDQIYLVDGMNMIKWDTPNVFELTDQKFVGWRDVDNMKWTHDSIMGYKDFFNGFELDRTKYISSGLIIFNESHKKIFESLKHLYYDNVDTFCKLQDEIVKKGTEQTPLNYWLQINNVEIKTDLPVSFKLTHLHRKEMFGYNWQLNESIIPYFIKYGYIWNFSGFAKDQRSKIMKQTWDIVKHHYDDNFILNRLKTKQDNKNTTSGKFKEDIHRIFSDPKYKEMTMLELGCHMGNTTRLYAECFNKVIAVEKSEHNLSIAKETCSDVDNVEFILSDVYDPNFNLPKADIVHIDAGHTYEHVVYDIDRCVEQLNNPIIIMDDYGHEMLVVRDAIDTKLNEGKLVLHTYIGEDKGYMASNNKVFIGREGMICNV
tara:strand:- start:4107 stop:5456 length:1350 start_codon:yes stop_codon:yes gene_type:complete